MARISEPTSKDLIIALNDMYNSWATICSGILSLQKDFDAVGIDDWFNDALNSSYVDSWDEEQDSLGEQYDDVFVTRQFDKLKMPEFCESVIAYIRTHAKSLQGDTSVGNVYTFKHISNPNKAQVINAFNALYDAMYTFASGVGGYYGVSDSVKEDLGEDWIDDALAEYDSVQDGPYFGTFSSSYDEGVMSMMEVRDGFEEYLKKGGKIKFSHSFESKLKIKVHERKSFEGMGIDWDSIQDIFHKYIIAGDSPNSLPVKSGGYTLAKGSIKGALKDSSGKSLFGLNYDFSDDTRGDIFVVNIGMSPADFAKVKSIAWDIADECDNGYYSAYVHAYSNEDGYYKDSRNDFGKHDYARACGIFDEDCGSSASSLGAAPTGGRRKMDDESVRRTRHYGR